MLSHNHADASKHHLPQTHFAIKKEGRKLFEFFSALFYNKRSLLSTVCCLLSALPPLPCSPSPSHPITFSFSLAWRDTSSNAVRQVRAKVAQVKQYANGIYRLETNDQLYEGVRFAWIIYDPDITSTNVSTRGNTTAGAATPWKITGVRLQSQVRPVNYTGSFKASDAMLTGSWYSGAYGSRLNMMPYGFNSILIDRGDRVYDVCGAAYCLALQDTSQTNCCLGGLCTVWGI